jgi:sulfatase maturation enzyme AslB (radical SAM superfamily)
MIRPKGKMDRNTFRKVMDKALAYGQPLSVDFTGMGEPFLNPLIFEFIGSISCEAKTSITTNGFGLTDRNIERLMESGLHVLTISFNGFDKDSYELMMGGLDFEKARSHLNSAIRMSRGKEMKVAVNVTVTKQVQDRLPMLKDFLIQAGVDQILFSKCHSRAGHLNAPHVCDTPMPPPFWNSRCDIFANNLFVAWNGDVLSCCQDIDGQNVLGDLNVDDFGSIVQLKRSILDKGVNFNICRRCNDMYRFMNASTPDGSPLSEWIYDLCAGADERADRLAGRIRELVRVVDEKEQTIRSLAERVNGLESQWEGFQTSLGGQLLHRFHRWRLMIAPPGSRRERLLQFIFCRTGLGKQKTK